MRMGKGPIRFRERLTGGIALALIAGCAPSTHEARTAAELADEVQVIAAVLRSHRPAPNSTRATAICLSRRLYERANLPSMPSSSVEESENYLIAHADDEVGQIPPRILDDRAIVGIIDHAEPGPSCTGVAFVSFSRVVFSGEIAMVSVSGRTSCARYGGTIRLRRNADGWRVVERGPPTYSGETDCDGELPMNRPGFIVVSG